MSGVADSGREIGHVNIDANDPEQKLMRAREAGAPSPRSVLHATGRGLG